MVVIHERGCAISGKESVSRWITRSRPRVHRKGSMVNRENRFISASEIGTWCYCKRAWYLQQLGRPSILTEERAAGTRYHERHYQKLRTTRRVRAVARAIMLVSLLLLIWLGLSILRFF